MRPEDKRGVSGSGTESSGHDRGRRRRERPGRGREVFEGVRGATCGFRVTLETAGHGHGRGRPAPSRTTQTASGQRLQAWFVTTDATGFWRAEVKDAADQPTGRPRSPQQRMGPVPRVSSAEMEKSGSGEYSPIVTSAYYVSGDGPGTEDTATDKTDEACAFLEVYAAVGPGA